MTLAAVGGLLTGGALAATIFLAVLGIGHNPGMWPVLSVIPLGFTVLLILVKGEKSW